jgi:hypothetical protein
MDADDDATIRQAISQKRLLRFSLRGRLRVAEPHDYGIRHGVPQLLVYQVGGESASGRLPNWRWVVLSEASGFHLLEQTFPGGRPAPSGRHSRWERLFARVGPASKRADPRARKARTP